MPQQTITRYTIWSLWFFVVPGLFALVVTWLCSSSPDVFGGLGDWVREQQVPAWIILFTLAEMSLYYFRHYLPFSEVLAASGPSGLPREVRRDVDAAQHLVVEANRIRKQNAPAIDKRLSEAAKSKLDQRLNALEKSLEAEPFETESFLAAFERATQTVDEHLAPWRKSEAREYIESILIAVGVALLLRAVVVEAFKIPSGSMLPTLQIDDHIFVNKFDYGPTIPFTSARLWENLPPGRGDVVVFEFPDVAPGEQGTDFIKRVIALPGDTLETDDGHPILNGWRVPSCFVGMYPYGERDQSRAARGELFVEFLGDNSYLTLYQEDAHTGPQGPFHVAEGEVWVMGDNRHNSHDSRMWNGGKGAGVPYGNIQGRAMFIWLPLSRLFVPVMGEPELPEGMTQELYQGVQNCLVKRPKDTTPPAPKAR